MLFRKKMEPACAYCAHSCIGENDSKICDIHGVVQPWEHCRQFRYDPLQREPEPPLPPKTDVDESAFEI